MRQIGAFLIGLTALATLATGQEAKPKAAAKAKAENPAYAKVQDVAGLPRVLLIGDSISIGYTVPTREALQGRANVHRPAANCGPTSRGVQSLDEWLGDGKWDVIHFNFGLHDVVYMDKEGKRIAPDKGQRQVSDSDYEKNLEAIVARLKKTGAKLIFATTTPVPQGTEIRNPGDEVRYNDIARRVMQRHNVTINDLYALALPKLADIQLPANVHFKPVGSQQLANQVAASITKALDTK